MALQRRTCHGDMFPVKMIKYNIKRLYILYIQHNVFIRFQVKIFPPDVWYNLNAKLITRKFCELRKNQTSPGLMGIERLILSMTKTVKSDYDRGGCTILIVCQISFLKQCRSHS